MTSPNVTKLLIFYFDNVFCLSQILRCFGLLNQAAEEIETVHLTSTNGMTVLRAMLI